MYLILGCTAALKLLTWASQSAEGYFYFTQLLQASKSRMKQRFFLFFLFFAGGCVVVCCCIFKLGLFHYQLTFSYRKFV